MSDVAANTSTTAQVVDGQYRGQFERIADKDWVAVELEGGVTYTFRGLGADSDNGSAQYIHFDGIYASSGLRMTDNPEDHYILRQDHDGYFTTEAQTEFTPGATGTYYVAMGNWDIDNGSYTLYVTEDVIGGDTDETLTGTDGHNWMLGGYGNDELSGGAGNDLIDGEWGNDTLTGGEGADLFRFYSDDWDAVNDDDADIFGQDTITDFNVAEDSLHFAGRILSDLDDFTITESGGNTTLTTDWGDSVTLIGVSASELTNANIRYRLGPRPEGGNLEGWDGDDTLVGGVGDKVIYGYAGNDSITGGPEDNYLRGFEGDDTLLGGTGDDIIGGGDGDNVIAGEAGDDFIIAHGGNDGVTGGAGDDLIETRAGNDTLSGGTGGDTLRGGRGDDDYTGGSGADWFVIGRSWGSDVIRDFSLSEDILDFRGTALELEDLTLSSSGDNTVISNGSDQLILEGVALADFEAVAGDILLGAGSITSHYSEYARTEFLETPTEDILVDTGIINDGNTRWAQDADGVTRVSYSFTTLESVTFREEGDTGSNWWVDASQPVTPLTQYMVEQVIAEAESYANIEFVWVADAEESAGNIRFSFHQFVIGGASTVPFESPYAADVLVGVHVGESFNPAFFVHEMGHSLGFDDLPYWNEVTGQDYTIMSYIMSARHEFAEFSSISSQNYQYADIAGMQYLYGVNTEATGGADKYSYDLAEGMLMTLFDAGGTDSIEVTGTGDAVHISLVPGTWSNIGPDILYEGSGQPAVTESGTLFIMPDTIIENAKGSVGDDTLTGNDAANVLRGMDGDDSVYGGMGGDTIWAGGGDTGDDTVDGGMGGDIIAGGAGHDVLVGGMDRDTVFGGTGNDSVVLGLWEDANADGLIQSGEVTGGDTATDTGYTGDGDDSLYGSDGDNIIGGGQDSDYIDGLGGDDVIFGGQGQGSDFILGGAGGDTLFSGGGDDTLTGGAGDDLLFNGGGNDMVRGQSGNDTLWGGGGDDILTGGAGADVFGFVSGNDSDTVTDFTVGEDRLDISAAGFASFEAFSDAASDTANGVSISFSQTIVLLEGISLASLSESDLIL